MCVCLRDIVYHTHAFAINQSKRRFRRFQFRYAKSVVWLTWTDNRTRNNKINLRKTFIETIEQKLTFVDTTFTINTAKRRKISSKKHEFRPQSCSIVSFNISWDRKGKISPFFFLRYSRSTNVETAQKNNIFASCFLEHNEDSMENKHFPWTWMAQLSKNFSNILRTPVPIIISSSLHFQLNCIVELL